ncbi:MAG: lmo0937 family membrane protein [Gemmatimonadota bacterium]|nr:lmo0937 family membrane protein [Gemmatimonadales bacterium]MDQ3136603.1 lmo0937 family membrane protein [Gemmatimonadota bacterium]
MRGLVALGVLLLVLWAIGFVVFKVAGLLIHLLLIVGAVMLILGLIRRVTGRSTT